jgi:hypothetical protein
MAVCWLSARTCSLPPSSFAETDLKTMAKNPLYRLARKGRPPLLGFRPSPFATVRRRSFLKAPFQMSPVQRPEQGN